jgi:hypothetical protein
MQLTHYKHIDEKFKDKFDLDKVQFNNSMNCGHVPIDNDFGNLMNWWHILKKINYKVDKVGRSLWHVVFFTIFQLMNMPKCLCDI